MSHATSTPSIRIYDSGAHHPRYKIPYRPSAYVPSTAIPMAIPNARESPPPPLPPPRYINEISEGQDPGWQWGNTPNGTGSGPGSFGSIKPGSSLLGAGVPSQAERTKSGDGFSQHEIGLRRRESSFSSTKLANRDMNPEGLDHSDEDRKGLARPPLTNHRLQSERQLGQRSLENSSQAYDKQLLSKIGGPNTPTRTSGPNFLSTSAQDASPGHHNSFAKLNGLKPLSMPNQRYPSLESPGTRWTSSSGAVSPAQTGFRSPVFEPNSCEALNTRRGGSGSVSAPGAFDESCPRSHRGSYDQSFPMDQDFGVEENQMRELHISDRSPSGSEDYQLGKVGLKRRATSPPTEPAQDRTPASASNDLYHRRSAQMLVNRNSPISRFHANHGSISSASSIGPRHGSFPSSYGLSVASSATSYSGERLSPGALSPSVDTEFGPVSPFATSMSSLNPSPRGSLSRAPQQSEVPHNRKMSADSVVPHSRQNSVSKMGGVYICDCCPKKPKKFDSEDELRIHEMEKQYTCAYCPNRFKNKNEAERHQNSLHLRRHSWSCAALAGVHAAFHPSPAHPTAADVCGYCGEEFPNPANWEARAEHLNHVHKFGECNQAKKFFRADHFRQHLKHSHAGTSGKWTNMLENACMKDEPPPPKERMVPVASLTGGAPTIAATKPGVIDEVRDES